MLKIFDLNKTEGFTQEERDKLIDLMYDGGVRPSYFKNVDFRWCPAMGLEVNGLFSIFHPNTVYLTSSFKGAMNRLAATAAHELDHRQWFLANPPLYFLMAIPGIRNFTIELSAEKLERSVNDRLKIDEAFRL